MPFPDLALPAITVIAVMVVVTSLVGVGSLTCVPLSRRNGPSGLLVLPFSLIAGWGLVAVISAVLALLGLRQTILFWLLLPVGLGAIVMNRALVGRDLMVALALSLPLAWMTASMPATMFDEFSHWLPNTRFLIAHDRYWGAGEWVGASGKPGYPNGTAIITLLISKIAGPACLDVAFKTFMVFCIIIFGWLVAGAREVASTKGVAVAWGLLALINPFFDPRIALTSYADAPSGIVLAAAVLAVAAALSAIHRQDKHTAHAWLALSGIVCTTLVMLRITNLIFIIGLVAVLIITLLRRENLTLPPIALVAIPPGLATAIWQFHLHQAGIGPDITPRPLPAWDWTAPITVLRSLFLDRLLNNPAMAAAALFLLVAAMGSALLIWRKRGHLTTPEGAAALPDLTQAASVVSIIFIGFLAWTYMAVFSPDEVARAASAWRYVSELGPLFTLTLAAAIPNPRLPKRGMVIISAVAGLAILLAPRWGHSYYGVSCRYVDVLGARKVIADLKQPLNSFPPMPGSKRVAIMHPTMADWIANMAAYDLGWSIAPLSFAFRLGESQTESNEHWAWKAGVDAFLDLSALDRATMGGSSTIPPVFLRGRPNHENEKWPIIKEIDAQPLPSPCSYQ